MNRDAAAALSVEALTIGRRDGGAPLVDALSLEVRRGEVLGIVGESGSGKSLTAFAIAGLLPPALAVRRGAVHVGGQDVLAMAPDRRRRMAGSEIGIVFQDPLSSFNPVRRIGTILVESAMRHAELSQVAARNRAVAMLGQMILPDPATLIDAYPHQLSGGQRQRVMIALALMNDPALLIADEPTTALDARVQRSILVLLKRHAAGRATMLITHDLGVAASLADRIMVMRHGRCIESGPARALIAAPSHEYTRALVAARAALVTA